jgi:phage host-nuclease inhibitor protein Gam
MSLAHLVVPPKEVIRVARRTRARKLTETEIDERFIQLSAHQDQIDTIRATTAKLRGVLLPVKQQVDSEIQQLNDSESAQVAEHTDAQKQLLLDLLGYFTPEWNEWASGPSHNVIQRILGSIKRRKPSKDAIVVSDEEALIERLKTLGLERFLNVKTTLDREAMHAEPDTAKAVEGVAFTSDYTYSVVLSGDRKAEATIKQSELDELLKP